ncbi:MAG TPA: BlaI/MecI/CopY family transcriptional regulator [Verrucomicrobiae bacterium]|nr:BlaI/MecI/CopY family transcriptional regulator [Verrucomicrobiae bacterium]
MPRKKVARPPLTPLELEIMSVLWETGPANVQTVQAALKTRDLAYTTVQTMLNVLHRKGRVKRRLEDRAYLYQPVLSRQKAMTQAVGDMLDRFFGGSADRLVLNLVESRRLTPEKLAELQRIVDRPADDPTEDSDDGR